MTDLKAATEVWLLSEDNNRKTASAVFLVYTVFVFVSLMR